MVVEGTAFSGVNSTRNILYSGFSSNSTEAFCNFLGLYAVFVTLALVMHYSTEAGSSFNNSEIVSFIGFNSTSEAINGFTFYQCRFNVTFVETVSDLPFSTVFDASILTHFGQSLTGYYFKGFVLFACFTFHNGNVQFAVGFDE